MSRVETPPRRADSAAPATPTATAHLPLLPSVKVKEQHPRRLAVGYVRQSTPGQVLHNRESTDRQYALDRRAMQLGWPAERVEVVDDDQGHSGQSAEGRSGFQSLLARIAQDQVGIVLGL